MDRCVRASRNNSTDTCAGRVPISLWGSVRGIVSLISKTPLPASPCSIHYKRNGLLLSILSNWVSFGRSKKKKRTKDKERGEGYYWSIVSPPHSIGKNRIRQGTMRRGSTNTNSFSFFSIQTLRCINSILSLKILFKELSWKNVCPIVSIWHSHFYLRMFRICNKTNVITFPSSPPFYPWWLLGDFWFFLSVDGD